MKDDYEIVKNAFKGFEIKEDKDVAYNPILKVRVENYILTFYFDVDEYRDEAELSNLIVEKVVV